MAAHIIGGTAYDGSTVIRAIPVIAPVVVSSIVSSVVVPPVVVASVVIAPVVPAIVVIAAIPVTAAIAVASTLPLEIECISFTAAFQVFDVHYGGTPIRTWIADEIHLTAPVNALKAEIGGVTRYGAGALKPGPTRRLTRNRVQAPHVSVDFYISGLVDANLDGAFAAISAAAPDGRSATRRHLRVSRRQENAGSCDHEKRSKH
jgi:hypothetical protein